jgi:hypothetical protein
MISGVSNSWSQGGNITIIKLKQHFKVQQKKTSIPVE